MNLSPCCGFVIHVDNVVPFVLKAIHVCPSRDTFTKSIVSRSSCDKHSVLDVFATHVEVEQRDLEQEVWVFSRPIIVVFAIIHNTSEIRHVVCNFGASLLIVMLLQWKTLLPYEQQVAPPLGYRELGEVFA